MWCHLCKKNYDDYEEFKDHILAMHRCSDRVKESSDSDSSKEYVDIPDQEVSAATSRNKKRSTKATTKRTSPGVDVPGKEVSAATSRKKKPSTNATTQRKSPRVDFPDEEVSAATSRKKKPSTNATTQRTSPRLNFPVEEVSAATCRKKKPSTSATTQRTSPRAKRSLQFKESCDGDLPDYDLDIPKDEVEDSKSISVEASPYIPMDEVEDSKSISVEASPYIPKDEVEDSKSISVEASPSINQSLNTAVTPTVQQPFAAANDNTFEFNSVNIQMWLIRHKELCRNLKYPLPASLFQTVVTIRKAIFDNYCMATSSEVTKDIMKVYEDLNNMVCRHIAKVHEQL